MFILRFLPKNLPYSHITTDNLIMSPVDELQEAFNACLAIPADDLRSSAEQNISRFIEIARKLEVFFLQRQLILSDSGDGCEEISKLQAQLKARENLIAKYHQKLEEWKRILD